MRLSIRVNNKGLCTAEYGLYDILINYFIQEYMFPIKIKGINFVHWNFYFIQIMHTLLHSKCIQLAWRKFICTAPWRSG